MPVVGIVWALVGLGNIIGLFLNGSVGEGLKLFGFLFNVLLFILPGLVVAGIGELLARRRR